MACTGVQDDECASAAGQHHEEDDEQCLQRQPIREVTADQLSGDRDERHREEPPQRSSCSCSRLGVDGDDMECVCGAEESPESEYRHHQPETIFRSGFPHRLVRPSVDPQG
jgi:hypothetical protein